MGLVPVVDLGSWTVRPGKGVVRNEMNDGKWLPAFGPSISRLQTRSLASMNGWARQPLRIWRRWKRGCIRRSRPPCSTLLARPDSQPTFAATSPRPCQISGARSAKSRTRSSSVAAPCLAPARRRPAAGGPVRPWGGVQEVPDEVSLAPPPQGLLVVVTDQRVHVARPLRLQPAEP